MGKPDNVGNIRNVTRGAAQRLGGLADVERGRREIVAVALSAVENIQKSAAAGIDRRRLLLPQVVAASY